LAAENLSDLNGDTRTTQGRSEKKIGFYMSEVWCSYYRQEASSINPH